MLRSIRFGLLITVAALLASSSTAIAGPRAFKARGSAQFVSPTDFVGSGNATHLGAYSEAGSVAFAPTENPAVLAVTGSITYTAANGDQLFATVSGFLNGATGAVTATITYDGGTGRFFEATGTSTLTGQLGAGGSISVSVSGSIDY